MTDGRITLSQPEMLHALLVGGMRQIENLCEERHHRWGASDEDGWRMDIEGAAGELAVARYLNWYWAPTQRGEPDLGERVQVRTATSHTRRLLLHPEDPDAHVYVLVTGLMPHYWVRGWCWGAEGKRSEWLEDPVGGRPAYFVPQQALEPLRTLRLVLEGQIAKSPAARG